MQSAASTSMSTAPGVPAVSGTTVATTPSHVFVLKADLMRLSCDARASPYVLEIDNFGGEWFRYPDSLRAARKSFLKLCDDVYRVDTEPAFAGPQQYVVNVLHLDVVGDVEGRAEWLGHTAARFVRAAAEDLRRRGVAPKFRRERHLVAMPVLGTGGGGASTKTIRYMMPALLAVADEVGVDVAIVTNESEVFEELQAERSRLSLPWPLLTDRQKAVAQRLAAQAAEGRLVLFLGSGVSAGCGLATWDGLLDELAAQVGLGAVPSPSSVGAGAGAGAGAGDATLPGDSEEALDQAMLRAQFKSMSWLDQARLLQTRLEHKGISLGEAVAARLRSDFHSTAHALLGSLPCSDVVTTNYDNLFEMAIEGVGGRVSVLPRRPVKGAKLTLLKMHGCVTTPNEIVLTRRDYIRYADHSTAVGGVLQALMLTKSVLYVGFGLEDDNFHRMHDAVQKARLGHASAGSPRGSALLGGATGSLSPSGSVGSPPPQAPDLPPPSHAPLLRATTCAHSSEYNDDLGTVITLDRNALKQELWEDQLNFVSMQAPGTRLPSDPVARGRAYGAMARLVDVFLDYVSFLTNTVVMSRNILNPRFEDLLTEEDTEMRRLLLEFKHTLDGNALARQSRALGAISGLFQSLGYRHSSRHPSELPPPPPPPALPAHATPHAAPAAAPHAAHVAAPHAAVGSSPSGPSSHAP